MNQPHAQPTQPKGSLSKRAAVRAATSLDARLACLWLPDTGGESGPCDADQALSGFNNGTIALSARDAARLCKINKDTAGRSFKELIEEGFIEAVTPGGFSRKDPHATEWRLTHQRCDKTGELPSKAFMRRRDEKQNAVPKQGQLGPKPRPEQSPE
jgi:hypothetical protein